MEHQRRRTVDRSALLIGISMGTLLAATPALAQTVPAPAPTPPTADQTPPAQTPPPNISVTSSGTDIAVSNPNAIVITGSRIRQPEFTSPDPVSRIDPTVAQHEGKLNVADMLQSSPIAAGSTQITSALSSNMVTNGGPGSETIDLRGLGANRTLVLLNGRRAGPAGTRGGVSSFDLNVLPESIVERVDILKTGASSIYGSDAVAGVVNLITKTDFNGLQIDGFGSVPFKHGGEEFSGSILAGKTFGDRGHVMVALDYYKQNELARGDRSYLDCPPAYIFRPGSNKERADLIDPRTGKYHCEDFPGPQVWTYDYEYNYLGKRGNMHLANGTYVGPVNLLQYFPGNTYGLQPIAGCGALSCFQAPPGWLPTGYDPLSQSLQDDTNPYIAEQTIIPQTERYTLYADASYEFTDHIEAYAEFLANRRKTYQNGWQQFWTFGYTEDGGPYYGGTYWAKGWHGLNYLSPLSVTDRGVDTKQRVDYWRGVGGLRGDLGGLLKGWSYDAYVQYSHNKGLYGSEQLLKDVMDITSFQSASCVGTITPVSHKQCMDLPWLDPNFLAGHFTPEQAAYMFDWQTGTTIYKQLSGEASITGNLFDLPAGPVGLALGITGRRDSIVDTPGAITLAGNAWGASSAGITAGHEITSEAFGEIQIPLIKDKPFFRDLSFNGAARITSVKAVQANTGVSESNKGNWTYKLGGNWAVNRWLRFRGTYGTSFRAPALFEEFKANETGFESARTMDPCVQWGSNLKAGNIDQRIADNCASQNIPSNYGGGSVFATVFSQGGIGELTPETSTAKTASVILTPHFGFLGGTNLSLAVDWFDIKVKGEISQLGAHNIVFGCYDSASFPTDPLCSLFARGETGNGNLDPHAITSVHDKYINIASQESRGFDFTGQIQHDLGRWGSVTLLGNATLSTKASFALFASTEEDLLGVINDTTGNTGTERFVGDLNLTWKPHGGWTFFWGANIFGKWSNNSVYKAVHAGSLCSSADPNDPTYSPTTQLYGAFCVRVSVPTVVYHSASVTKKFDKLGLELTLGVRNIFDTRPPQVSSIGGTGLPLTIGPVIATSQYDFLGRRLFFNVSKKF